MRSPLVIIESPYIHKTSQGMIIHRNYMKLCIIDSIERGEAPFAGHAFFTQFLNDRDKRSRAIGMRLTREFFFLSSLIAVYEDLGISSGMKDGIAMAERHGKPISYRTIGTSWEEIKAGVHHG